MTEVEQSARPELDDTDWQNGQGEAPDNSAQNALQLAHRAVNKFPELTKRYQKFIGTAAVVSTAVIILASIAVNRRLHKGESPDRILAEITPDEIENVGKEKRTRPDKAKQKNDTRHLH